MMKWCHVTLESEANACKSKINFWIQEPIAKNNNCKKSINAAKNPFRKNAIFVLANPIATTTVVVAIQKLKKNSKREAIYWLPNWECGTNCHIVFLVCKKF